MAVYKVPQDVEAEDKLIGPFSFRQFIYLIVAAGLCVLAWFLGRLFLPLALIPIAPAILFGALALPLRKDQPMEVFLAALVSFYLKPHLRLWDPDGTESLVEITAPKSVEEQLTKDLSQGEAEQRLSYLAEVVDSRGWSVRGQGAQPADSALNSDIYFEAQQAQDIFDTSASVAQTLGQKLEEGGARRRQELLESMQKQIDAPAEETEPHLEYNPYPENMQQAVIDPLDPRKATEPPKPNNAIINLMNATNLSVATIARQANRIAQEQELDEGAVVAFR